MITRRFFLGTTALVGAGAVLGMSPRHALALRAEEDEARERLYVAACEARSAHDEVIRDLIAELEAQEGRDKAIEIVRSMKCPYCGCALGPSAGAAADTTAK